MRILLGDKLTEYFQHKNFKVDFTWDNYRLFFMSIACIFATLTHFNGREFPDNLWIVVVCILGFGTINCSIMAFDYFIKKDIMTTVYSKEEDGRKFYCRGELKRFSEFYNVALEYTENNKQRLDQAIYVGKFFDAEGYFDQDSFYEHLDRLVARFQKQRKKD